MSLSRVSNWSVTCETKQWKVSGRGLYTSILKITKQNHSRIYILNKEKQNYENKYRYICTKGK